MYARMRLEIDAGNTLAKWRVINLDGDVVDRGVADRRANISRTIASNDYKGQIGTVLIASVSGSDLVQDIARLLAPGLGLDRIFVARSLPVMAGVTFAYGDVTRLGVDRCLAMISGYHKYPNGVMVIDCGSAITADIVSCTGMHLGGYILPGIRLLKASLQKGTAQVHLDATASDALRSGSSVEPGTSTIACVDNGVHLMIRSTFSSLQAIAYENGVRDIVLTGGDGELANTMAGSEFAYHRDLIFDGLGLLNPF